MSHCFRVTGSSVTINKITNSKKKNKNLQLYLFGLTASKQDHLYTRQNR